MNNSGPAIVIVLLLVIALNTYHGPWPSIGGLVTFAVIAAVVCIVAMFVVGLIQLFEDTRRWWQSGGWGDR